MAGYPPHRVGNRGDGALRGGQQNSSCLEPERKVFHAEQKRAVDGVDGNGGVAFELRHTLKELRDRDPGLEARKRSADAEVNSDAEPEVAVRRAPDVETLGLDEMRFVVVGGRDPHDERLPRVDALPGNLD